MAIFFYNAAILFILPLALAYLAIQLLVYRRYRESVIARFGRMPRSAEDDQGPGPVLWVHAVSVGEVMAVIPLAKALKLSYPEGRLLVSTVTETGQATARQKIPEADQVIYFPFDLPWIVRRVIRKIRPSLFIFVETEIWPNFLFALAQENIPAAMVNGRISAQSYRGYKLLAPFFRKVLEGVSLFSVRTDLDRERLLALGVEPQKVIKTGNMKYDQAIREFPGNQEDIRRGLKLPDACKLIVAGSTHEGEEEVLISCYMDLSKRHAAVRLLLAPRRLDRIERIERLVERQGLKAIRKTKIDSYGKTEIPTDTLILLDTLGELQQVYSVATLVFIGGSLVPIGGHNVLEPAACAKPILFGPHMENFHEIARLMIERKAALQVQGPNRIYEQMDRLLANPEQSTIMGVRAREVVMEQQGVVDKNLSLLRDILDH